MAGGKTGSKQDSESGKGKVQVTIHKLGSDEELTFEDGDTVGHMIDAIAASDNLEIKIRGIDARTMKDEKIGSIAGPGRKVEASATQRRGSNG